MQVNLTLIEEITDPLVKITSVELDEINARMWAAGSAADLIFGPSSAGTPATRAAAFAAYSMRDVALLMLAAARVLGIDRAEALAQVLDSDTVWDESHPVGLVFPGLTLAK